MAGARPVRPQAVLFACGLNAVRSPMAAEVEYWPTPDPTLASGNREQQLEAYRQVRDQLMARIKSRFGWRPGGNE